jgi:hypothetical protein
MEILRKSFQFYIKTASSEIENRGSKQFFLGRNI